MFIQSYLFFEGRCEEALAFYRRVLGAEVSAMLRYKDNPAGPAPAGLPAGSEDKIMHASFRVGETELLASDGMCSGQTRFQGQSLCLNVDTEADARRFFSALAEEGDVRMPLEKTFFSPCFGMLADRYGLGWMILVPA